MATPGWQPSQDGANQIVSLLSEFQKPGTNQAQVRASPDRRRCQGAVEGGTVRLCAPVCA